MAEFTQAFAHVLGHEGGYVDDPADAGGETYKGIARVHHGDWGGFRRIDAARERDGFPDVLEEDGILQRQVRKFYKDHYWDRLLGDHITDQALATELFDTGVNMGLRTAVRFLQESVNLLDRGAPGGLVVDGWLGRKTLDAVHARLSEDGGSAFLLQLINILQGHRYVEIMRANPGQERFARGWLRRVSMERDV